MVHQIVYNFHLSVAPQFLEGYILIVLAMALGYFMHFSPKKWSEQLEEKYHAQSGLVQAVVLALSAVAYNPGTTKRHSAVHLPAILIQPFHSHHAIGVWNERHRQDADWMSPETE